MNFHTFPAVLFIPLRPSCLFFSSYAASLCGTVLFVSWKPKGALWSCEKQLLTSCFSSCACAQHGPYRFVACICNMCVYLPMHMHAKKCSVFICFFLILPFLRNASQTCSDSLSRADLICIFLLGFMEENFEWLMHESMCGVCVFGWHTLSQGWPLGMCSVPTD